jgi:peptidoglycan/LPS O-acetylase OafA/YrhL
VGVWLRGAELLHPQLPRPPRRDAEAVARQCNPSDSIRIMTTIPYRREIDGLRALAVLPVIFFHAGVGLFSGGFVGVDVFFVISGYLITSVILAEQDTDTFVLLRFYERRARRLLPALFFVLFACLPMAWLWLLPNDMREFGRSLMAVSLSASNVLFWQQSGYFDTATELKPLLHTWSLAVEEQYYLLFPPLLMLMRRWDRKLSTVVLLLLAVVSTMASQWNLLGDPAAAFYLLPNRAGELLIGSLTAFHLRDDQRVTPSVFIRDIGSGLGLVMLAGATFGFDKNTPFPGTHALLPTSGGPAPVPTHPRGPGTDQLQHLPLASTAVRVCTPRHAGRTECRHGHHPVGAHLADGRPELALCGAPLPGGSLAEQLKVQAGHALGSRFAHVLGPGLPGHAGRDRHTLGTRPPHLAQHSAGIIHDATPQGVPGFQALVT